MATRRIQRTHAHINYCNISFHFRLGLCTPKIVCVGVDRGLKTVFSMKTVPFFEATEPEKTHKCHCTNVVLDFQFSAFSVRVIRFFFFWIFLITSHCVVDFVVCGLSVCMRAPSDTFVLYAMIICASSTMMWYIKNSWLCSLKFISFAVFSKDRCSFFSYSHLRPFRPIVSTFFLDRLLDLLASICQRVYTVCIRIFSRERKKNAAYH